MTVEIGVKIGVKMGHSKIGVSDDAEHQNVTNHYIREISGLTQYVKGSGQEGVKRERGREEDVFLW